MTTEFRESYLNAFKDKAQPYFEALGKPIPINTRISIGFPSTGYRGNTIAECWSDTASGDGHFEIFIKPTNATDVVILEALTHELCHAALGTGAEHGPEFKRLATGLGLTGPMRSTTGGEKWMAWALPIMQALGPMPYAPIREDMVPPKPKKKTFGVKLECPDCGWLARVSKKHIEPHTHLECPVPTCEGILNAYMNEGEEGEGD